MDFGYHFDESDSSRAGLLDRAQLPFADALEATARDAWVHNPSVELYDYVSLRLARDRADSEAGVYDPGASPSTVSYADLIDPAVLNKKYAALGLKFDQPTTSGVVDLMVARKQRDLALNAALTRAPDSLTFKTASFLTQLAVSAVDPLNVAAAFVPVVGEARFGIWAERLGNTLARVAKGGIEGAVGTAALEPLRATTETAYGNHYDPMESFLNVAFGAVLGGGLHAGFGVLSDLLAKASPETREAALRGAVAQSADGRAVDVSPILQSDPVLRPATPEAQSIIDAADRVEAARGRVNDAQTRANDAADALAAARQTAATRGLTARTALGANVDEATRDQITGSIADETPQVKPLLDAHAAAQDDLSAATQNHAAAANELADAVKGAQAVSAKFANIARKAVGSVVTADREAGRVGVDLGGDIAQRARTQRLAARTALRTGDMAGIPEDALAAEARAVAVSVKQAGENGARDLIERGREATLAAARGETPSPAVSPMAAAEAARTVKAKLGDDIEAELEHAQQVVSDLQRQGVLDAGDAAAMKAAQDGLDQANRFGDAAKAAGYCLALHP